MEANKTHISSKTAELLKDCGVERRNDFFFTETKDDIQILDVNSVDASGDYPAYTWQEILWENAEEFFGDEEGNLEIEYPIGKKQMIETPASLKCPLMILSLLQQNKYKEADLYFRKHCKIIL